MRATRLPCRISQVVLAVTPASELQITPYLTDRAWQGRMKGLLERSSVAAEAAEHGVRVARCRLPHELAAGLDLAVQPCRELLRLLARRDSGDHVRPAPDDAVAVRLEPVGE